MKKTYLGAFPLDKLPPVPENKNRDYAYIINSATSTSPGEHWFLVFIKKKGTGVVWFDSLGNLPSFYGHKLVKWLGPGFEFNKGSIQAANSSYCGLFVIFVLYYLSRNVPLRQILTRFSTNLRENDRIVASFAWEKFRFNAKTGIK